MNIACHCMLHVKEANVISFTWYDEIQNEWYAKKKKKISLNGSISFFWGASVFEMGK